MAARKLAQEVDKCFKKVAEGVAEFESIYEKIEQSSSAAQKDKLEDNLKREIKKLQRLRDQIKTWAASNDIKDKAPLLEHRRLIETQMEKFKAVEKAMKTKAYSKEGLSAAAKLDPREQAKLEASDFLSGMVDELEQQIETLEAESESMQATMKKGKGQSAKAERLAEIERIIERHKWHQGKLELIRRSLENGGVEVDQVTDLEESIRYYVSDGMNDDFMEDDTMYDDLALEEDEDNYGMGLENDKGSSQDTQSIQEEPGETEARPINIPAGKQKTPVDSVASSQGRRPSTQLKSPLPTLATLHNPLATVNNNNNNNNNSSSSSSNNYNYNNNNYNYNNGAATINGLKPASVPTRPAGEGLKYASAAAAAAASDKNNVGIAPLPPPPGSTAAPAGVSPLPPAAQQARASAANSPSIANVQPASGSQQQGEKSSAPTAQQTSAAPPPAGSSKAESKANSRAAGKALAAPEPSESSKAPQANGVTNGVKSTGEKADESIYHLPASLQDLVESFEVTKKRPASLSSTATMRMLAQSQATQPDTVDSEAPRAYRPEVPFHSSSQYPQEPLAILDDPRLYSRIDPDTLFYVFYYKQGTNQQYLAAKALKDQSWRFHKQYQTWFQRHEEPKSITEEYEQGTYRFFDYESTWMNRRKADFKFAYKFLEDDV